MINFYVRECVQAAFRGMNAAGFQFAARSPVMTTSPKWSAL